jgi:hypothetical protein
MRFKSTFSTEASGSLGGLQSRPDPRGSTLRAPPKSTTTRTTRRNAAADELRQIIDIWRRVLTPAQRQEWEQFAARVPVAGRLGQTVRLDGLRWFIRQNTPRGQRTQWPLRNAPKDPVLGQATILSVIDGGRGTVEYDWSTTDPWTGQPAAELTIIATAPTNPTRTTPPGRRQQVTGLRGNTFQAFTPPAAFSPPFGFPPGSRVFIGFKISPENQGASRRVYYPVDRP